MPEELKCQDCVCRRPEGFRDLSDVLMVHGCTKSTDACEAMALKWMQDYDARYKAMEARLKELDQYLQLMALRHDAVVAFVAEVLKK